jgi:hypothetical protein
MKAVFSFWSTTEDSLVNARNWFDPKFQLYSWVLAINQAKKWYDRVEIVTDSLALPIFEKLKLPYTEITTVLDELIDYDKASWALGKIKAYQIQNEPFVHIDNDVFLLQDILKPFENESIVCQNIENGFQYKSYYEPMLEMLEESGVNILNKDGLPQYWRLTEDSPCMAVYLCNDLRFNEEYCRAAFNFVDTNEKLLYNLERSITVPLCFSVIFEQYLAGQIAWELGVPITPICPTRIDFEGNPYANFLELEGRGYVHIWGAKRNEEWFKNLEKIIKRDYPEQFEIIQSFY